MLSTCNSMDQGIPGTDAWYSHSLYTPFYHQAGAPKPRARPHIMSSDGVNDDKSAGQMSYECRMQRCFWGLPEHQKSDVQFAPQTVAAYLQEVMFITIKFLLLFPVCYLFATDLANTFCGQSLKFRMGDSRSVEEGNRILAGFGYGGRAAFMFGWIFTGLWYVLLVFLAPHRWWAIIYLMLITPLAAAMHAAAGQTWCSNGDCAFFIPDIFEYNSVLNYYGLSLYVILFMTLIIWAVMHSMQLLAKTLDRALYLERVTRWATFSLFWLLLLCTAIGFALANS